MLRVAASDCTQYQRTEEAIDLAMPGNLSWKHTGNVSKPACKPVVRCSGCHDKYARHRFASYRLVHSASALGGDVSHHIRPGSHWRPLGGAVHHLRPASQPPQKTFGPAELVHSSRSSVNPGAGEHQRGSLSLRGLDLVI